MKRRILGIIVTVAIAVAATWNFNQEKNEIVISELALANVEALANGESSSCSDSCKEWSGNSGGGIACDCKRYTGKCKNRC